MISEMLIGFGAAFGCIFLVAPLLGIIYHVWEKLDGWMKKRFGWGFLP